MRSRSAFTLLELLVVLAMIATLIGLLLPAVQKVRAAAARIECANNLKQLGLALHHYHDGRGSLPSGYTSKSIRDLPRSTFLTRILPYLEQGPLWNATVGAFDYQPIAFVNPPHIGMSQPIRTFACPADGRVFQPQQTHENRQVALTSYVGVLGTNYHQRDGVLHVNSRTRLVDIADGTSNTILVGERPPSADFWYGWWYAGFGQAGTGSADMLLGSREQNFGGPYVSRCPTGPYHFAPGQVNNQCDLFHFWSLHSGGAHFLFADGSIHFLTYDADRIMPALATRAGGEVNLW